MAIKLSEVAEGSILLLNENGSPVEFYVAKHDYESDLNGTGRTLVVRKDVHSNRAFNTAGTNSFAASSILTWLNNDYFAMLDDIVQDRVADVTYPSIIGNGNTTLSECTSKVFLLSIAEVGLSYGSAAAEGTTLSIADTLKIAYLSGTASYWFVRTPYTSNTTSAVVVSNTGTSTALGVTAERGIRPAFTLPATVEVGSTDSGYALAPIVNAPNLGPKRTAFSFTYSVTDPSGGTVDIVETLDGAVIGEKTGIASGTEVECVVDEAIFDGLADATEHTIVITATNADGLTATAEVVFRKQVDLLKYKEYIELQSSYRQTLADILTEKGVEASGTEGYASLVPKVASIEAGTKLPTLTNPATADKIINGYEAIDGEGKILTGTLGSTLSNPATAAEILSGYEAIDGDGNLVTGTMAKGNTFKQISVSDFTLSAGGSQTISFGGTAKMVTLDCSVANTSLSKHSVNGETVSGILSSVTWTISATSLKFRNSSINTFPVNSVKLYVTI